MSDTPLTCDDFNLIIEGLEALPNKFASIELMETLMIPDIPELKIEKIERSAKAAHQKQELKDNIFVLMGKLVVLKRNIK